MASKRKRTKRSGFVVGDKVLARGGDDWKPGTVSRSLFRGTEVDVRCDDGTMLRNLTSKDVKELDNIECGNCGMLDVPLEKGFCAGCICKKCKRNAEETGCSMNEMGWCDSCERLLQEG